MEENNEENLLDQGKKDLLQTNSSTEQITTEVTSIQQQEDSTGQKVNVPSAEDLVARASSSMMVNKKLLNDLLTAQTGGKYRLSRKAMTRILLSVLDLPTDGIPVHLKSDDEKLAFGVGQRMVADRFILTQFHISKEMEKRKLQQENSEQTKSEEKTSAEGGTNE